MAKDGKESTPPPSSEPTPEELYKRIPLDLRERLARLKSYSPEAIKHLKLSQLSGMRERFKHLQFSPEWSERFKALQRPPETREPRKPFGFAFDAAEQNHSDFLARELDCPRRMEELKREEVELARKEDDRRQEEVELRRREVEALEAQAASQTATPAQTADQPPLPLTPDPPHDPIKQSREGKGRGRNGSDLAQC
jgi:hypothetical protein